MTKLTSLAVARAKPKRDAAGALQRTEIADGGGVGLYLVVQPSSAKSWALRYRRPDGRPAKLTLGDAGDAGLTLQAARQAAAAAQVQIEQGIDPGAAKQAAAKAQREDEEAQDEDTVAALVKKFIELHVKRKTRPATQAQTESVLQRFVLPAWGKRSIHDVTKRNVIALVEEIAVDRPIMANRTLAVVSKFFNWLVARDVIAASPAASVERPTVEQARERVLDDAELTALWKACEDDVGVAGAVIRVMMLTGARKSEVAELPFSEIDEAQRLWNLPKERAKNKKAHQTPLSTTARRILSAQPRICDYVFSSTGSGPVTNFSRIKERLDAKLKFAEPWVLHDIRRSVASGLQRLGYSVEVIEAALGHRSGVFKGIVGVYQRHPYTDERRAALQDWADHLDRLASGKPAKVLTFQQGRRR